LREGRRRDAEQQCRRERGDAIVHEVSAPSIVRIP
jgi:hypothetical protein